MGEYANITAKRLSQFLQWLSKDPSITIVPGGRHAVKVSSTKSGLAFPLPLSHRIVNKYIVKGLRDWLIAHGVCSKDEFDRHII